MTKRRHPTRESPWKCTLDSAQGVFLACLGETWKTVKTGGIVKDFHIAHDRLIFEGKSCVPAILIPAEEDRDSHATVERTLAQYAPRSLAPTKQSYHLPSSMPAKPTPSAKTSDIINPWILEDCEHRDDMLWCEPVDIRTCKELGTSEGGKGRLKGKIPWALVRCGGRTLNQCKLLWWQYVHTLMVKDYSYTFPRGEPSKWDPSQRLGYPPKVDDDIGDLQ